MIFKKWVKLLSLIGVTMISGICYGQDCNNEYCWDNKESMFIQAEIKFIEDMDNGLHKHLNEEKNKCPYHLSSIAYWFAQIESWLWKWKVAQLYNNWFSIKKWSWKYSYIWEDKFWYSKTSKYLNYPNPFLSVLEFMHIYKYGYLCKLSKNSVGIYKMWTYVDDHNTNRYYTNLINSIEKFEKQYFWNWEKLNNYSNKSFLEKLNILKFNNKEEIFSTEFITYTDHNWNLVIIEKENNWYEYIYAIKDKIFLTFKSAIEYIDTI